MRLNKKLTLTAAICLLVTVFCGSLTVSADEWSWASYGFSGTAIANPDPLEPTSYLIGGYVSTVHHQHPLTSSYVYKSNIILDTEGVAIRFRFSWANTEPGYKAVADLKDGIAIYPMDKSIDLAIATEGDVTRFSFPVPAMYDYMSANEFLVMDNSDAMTISVSGKTVAILKFSGTRSSGGKTCYESITVTDGNGYVYGRVSDTLVLSQGGYAGYSSQKDRALILVKDHSLEDKTVDFDQLPTEKETEAGWVPETETIPETHETVETQAPTVTETEGQETEHSTESAVDSVSEAATVPESIRRDSETSSADKDKGCASMIHISALLLTLAGAVVLRKKHV